MSSKCKQFHIIFNGEIYNNKILRSKLENKGHKFTTDHSDTETILIGYIEWGIKVFEQLSGMFSIAIFDNKLSKIYIARDIIGIKPLYYYNSITYIIIQLNLRHFYI